jgi:hypothetical protein
MSDMLEDLILTDSEEKKTRAFAVRLIHSVA